FVDKIDESNLVKYVRKGRTKANDLTSDLHELDAAQAAAISSVKKDLQIMDRYISELEVLFNDGNFSIADYNLSAMREMDAFRAITESVYGEEGLIGIILNKLGNGEPLTDLERNNLYDYFQNEILDDTKYYHLRNK